MALFIIGSFPITSPVSADDEIDNWPENDAWLHIELISWSANETVEWDSNGGLPDPIFKICVEADGDNLDCINTPTWENQLTLNNSWNYSIDIPDHTNILNITIECEDNDALNDDECDMNSELDEWKLYAEYNWSATPTLTVSGNGDGDGNETWKNAASTWKFTIDGFGDEDGDGVSDSDDACPGYDDLDDFDDDGNPSGCDNDDDGDGTPDEDDGCPDTPLGAIVDWGCPMDEDEDGVYDGLDDCPNSNSGVGVDANGCDLDSDGDGIPDWDDECANTPQGEEINLDDYDYWGCSSSQIDRDNDGVNDNLDQCPNSVGYSGVDSNGCDLDSDGDGTPDFDDECANTPQGATVDYMGCPSDLDGDGVFDGLDECPSSNNPAPSDMDKSGEVDSTGCFKQNESTNDDVNSDSESSSGSSFGVCFGLFGILIIGFIIKRGSSKSNSMPVTTVTNQMPTHGQQIQSVVNRLEQQRVNAQYEANQLKKQLADTASLSSAQMQSMQSEMKRLQDTIAQTEIDKLQMQEDLEKAKSTAVVQNVQNITYNIQDSAISGDLNVTGVDQKEE